jgi:hypothetical protein
MSTVKPSLVRFGAGIVALAIACRFLLPGTMSLTIQSGGIAKGYHYQHVVFWLVLGIGAIILLLRLVKFFAAR